MPIDLPHHIVKKVVELLYFREVGVHRDHKEAMMDAIKLLKIDGIADDDGFKAPMAGMYIAHPRFSVSTLHLKFDFDSHWSILCMQQWVQCIRSARMVRQ